MSSSINNDRVDFSFYQPIQNYARYLKGQTKELLIQYIKENNPLETAKLLEQIDITDIGKDCEMLVLAVQTGNTQMVKVLLDKGFRPDLYDPNTQSTLAEAAQNGFLKIATLLTEKHLENSTCSKVFDPPLLSISDFINMTSSTGMTPLMVAGMFNQPSMVDFFLDWNADPNRQNLEGDTLFHICIRKGTSSTIFPRVLECRNVNLNIENNSTETPLTLAMLYSQADAVKILACSGKVDLNYLSSRGNQPLNVAFSVENLKIIEHLLKNGADSTNQDNEGNFPLFRAKVNNQTFITEYFKHREPKSYALAREAVEVKMLAHVSHIAGTSLLKSARIPLEGFHAPYIHIFLSRRIKKFSELTANFDQNLLKSLSQASSFFSVTHHTKPYDVKNLWDNWKAGNPIYVSASVEVATEGHTMGVVILKNQMVFCNRWSKSSTEPWASYQAFCFNPRLFTVDILSSITDLTKTVSEKIDYIEKELIIQLDGRKTLLHNVLENHKIRAQNFLTGNCSWLNSQGLQLPHCVLYQVNKLLAQKIELNEEQIKSLINEQALLCDNLLSYYQCHLIGKAIRRVLSQQRMSDPDLNLISKSLTLCYPYLNSNKDPALMNLWHETEKNAIQLLSPKSLEKFHYQKVIRLVHERISQVHQLLDSIHGKRSFSASLIEEGTANPAKRMRTDQPNPS